ncbi:MAG: RNA methyltransferase [Methanosarcinales archaeon]|nr:RNA methyltransferase [Methanosarcinales archaeon]
MELQVVLVEPLYDGNVGSVARAMKNFGFRRLVLVKPCRIGDFGLAMASHARDVLEEARVVFTVEDAVAGANLVVGTTGKLPGDQPRHLKLHLRVPHLTPAQLASRLRDKEGTVALLLGREDWGLTRTELEICDMVVSIPTSPRYPIMNLSHAATVLLYELGQLPPGKVRLAGRENLERVYKRADALLAAASYPEHKIVYVSVMLRRILGRAQLTDREANTLLGIFKHVLWKLDKNQQESLAGEGGEGVPSKDPVVEN